jgi:LAO/AO transport system kinase
MSTLPPLDDTAVFAALRQGQRRALGRAITLVESSRSEDRNQADALVAACLPFTGTALRVGISGPPGVGKSTFIERFGLWLLARGRKVAVLAVDPSSPVSGGSILGDKTRMQELAVAPNAFIRPSPAGTALGGVAARTRDASLLCEAAGYDTILIETVGVGQSEHAVHAMVDTLMVMLSPGGGDDLQGVKRGIIELADVLVVHKADGDRLAQAQETADAYRSAGRLFARTTSWQPPVLQASALHNVGFDEVWLAIQEHRTSLGSRLPQERATRAARELWREVGEQAIAAVHDHVDEAWLRSLVDDVGHGRSSPSRAAAQLLQRLGLASRDRAQ